MNLIIIFFTYVIKVEIHIYDKIVPQFKRLKYNNY
jgi:hypothetical protein